MKLPNRIVGDESMHCPEQVDYAVEYSQVYYRKGCGHEYANDLGGGFGDGNWPMGRGDGGGDGSGNGQYPTSMINVLPNYKQP